MNPQRLQHWLSDYNESDKKFLVDGFTEGFKIPFQGVREQRFCNNLKSADQNLSILQEKINNEVRCGRAAGPFKNAPFNNFQCSPLGLVPKKQEGEFRVIHHLSYPEGQSINDGIPQDICSVQYQTIDDATNLLKQLGRGVLFAKTDIENAFKIIPVHPSDRELLGFRVGGGFYFDKTLPMGLSYSCNLFERFSSSLHWVMEYHYQSSCVHVLDDFLFMGPAHSNNCLKSLENFLQLCNDIGIPIKNEKTVYPTTTITFLGLEVDSLTMEVRLPRDKLDKLRDAIDSFKHRKKVSLKELQSLIGLLNFACAAVRPGRTFLRRLTDLTKGLKLPHFKRRLNTEARADLEAWSVFINSFNGRSLILDDRWETSETLCMYTDASDLGFGGTFKTKWFFGEWPQEWGQFHITVRELLPIVITLELWASDLRNSCINFYSDNIAVVYIINKQTSADPIIMKLMRRFIVNTLKYNILFKATHIPGVLNVAADRLSRLQVREFQDLCTNMDPVPSAVHPTMLTL